MLRNVTGIHLRRLAGQRCPFQQRTPLLNEKVHKKIFKQLAPVI